MIWGDSDVFKHNSNNAVFYSSNNPPLLAKVFSQNEILRRANIGPTVHGCRNNQHGCYRRLHGNHILHSPRTVGDNTAVGAEESFSEQNRKPDGVKIAEKK